VQEEERVHLRMSEEGGVTDYHLKEETGTERREKKVLRSGWQCHSKATCVEQKRIERFKKGVKGGQRQNKKKGADEIS